MTISIKKIVKAALLFVLVSPMIAMADLCPSCQDKMFTSDIGTCKECSQSTSSGALRLCSTCSKKNRQCEACQAKLQVSKPPVGDIKQEKPADALTLEKLLEAPTEIVLGNKKFVLETYLWRNLMPGIDRKNGLIATITIKTSEKGIIPEGTTVEKIWIVNGTKQWSPEAFEVSDLKDQPTIKIVARNGPTWEPGTKVHVIVKMKDAQDKSFLLKISEQTIDAVH